jgi:hypothetical protein
LLLLLSQIAVLGLTLLFLGLQLVYKNVGFVAWIFSLILLFASGALVSFQQAGPLQTLSRFLPLSVGIRLMQKRVEGAGILELLSSSDSLWLWGISAVYLLVGILVFHWGQQKARRLGILGDY